MSHEMQYVLGFPDDEAAINNKPTVAFGPFGSIEEALTFMIESRAANASAVTFDGIPVGVPVVSVAQAQRYYDQFHRHG